MHTWQAILLIIISLFLKVNALASEESKVNNLLLEQFSIKEGLSQGTVNSILASESGFLWLATDSGLNIYDGYTIKQLPGPNNQFINASIYTVKQDSLGWIWINTDEGLYRFDPKTNKYQLVFNATRKQYAIDVVEGKDNADINGYWVATSKAVSFFSPEENQFGTTIDLSAKLRNKDIIYQVKHHNKILYIATRIGVYGYIISTGELRKIDGLSEANKSNDYNLFEASKSYTLAIINNDTLFIGTNDGVFSVNIQEVESYLHSDHSYVTYNQVLKDASIWQLLYTNKQLYVASNKGLHQIEMLTQQANFLFGFSDYYENVSNNTIISLASDKSGTFWLGSETSGVYSWDPNRSIIRNYRYGKNIDKNLSHNAVWTIERHKHDANHFWVGTSRGFNLVNDKEESIEQYFLTENSKNQFTENHIYQIYNYLNDSLMLSTAKGILIYDPQTKQIIEPDFSDEVSEILSKEHYAVYLQEQRYLWLVYEDNAVMVDLQSGSVDDFSSITSEVEINEIYSFYGLLPDTRTMLFSTKDSLWGYELESKTVRLLYKHEGISDNKLGSFDSWVIDKNNVFWLSYPTVGLIGLDYPSFEKKYFYHRSNSIIDNNVYSLLTDNEGDLWFSTHKGLFLLYSNEQHIRQFTIDDGLSAMEFNFGAKLKLKEGQLIYGSMEGVSIFDPLHLKNKHVENDIQVYNTGIDVISRSLDLPVLISQQETVQLKYDDVGIRFDFSTLSNADKQDVIFEYQLIGNSPVTYPATIENKITFPNLPSGKHILSVRAISPFTGEYSPSKQIAINVSYAPLQSPFAYAVYAGILLLISGLWLYRRLKQRQQLLADHEEVKFRENRLQLALVGSNSEVWDWQANNNLMFGKRISQELGYVDLATAHSFDEHVALIHFDDKEKFLSRWQAFITANNSEDTFSCTYRLKHADGHWLWYKDLGKIVSLDDEQQVSRITGSYTNITQTRAEEVRSQYYGDAFKQTNDWVLIVNDSFTQVTANQSLRSAFDWPDENFQFNSKLLGLTKPRWQFYKQLLPSLKEGEHWRGEELVTTDFGEEFHVIVNINVGMDDATKRLYFVCVFTDISAQKAAEKELRYLANYDYLTDLPNRSLLLERIKHAIEISKQNKTSIALFFIDLDKFKQVNDSLGHDNGDLLLVEVTRRLSELLRGDDTVARIGGDEFVVLIESFQGVNKLGQIAQRIITTVGKPVTLQENKVIVGASIGIALYPDDAKDCNALLRHADVAMYHAKQLGRNTFQFFTSRMNLEANQRLAKESSVKLAYNNDEFFNHYQPIIDAHTGKAVGFELLMRWQSSEGLIAPAGFIDIAEELGLIIPMTESALERGLVDLKKWHSVREGLYLSVNISPQHFAKECLVNYIITLLKKHDLPAKQLKIEVTESALISEPEQSISTMKRLAELGVVLALDDFGTGFSSLSYLKQLPLDIIKIDRSFVAGIGQEKADEAIVDTTLVLAKRLNMHCIAEGVETLEQLNYLTQRQCHFIQGYLYCKPVDEKTIGEYLSANKIELTSNKG